jgi:DNA topoisomerase-1
LEGHFDMLGKSVLIMVDCAGKAEGNDLFDKLDTTKLNLHLKAIMPGLTAKVFRTYNASITLDKLVL